MSDQPLVSVIIPTYKRPDRLARAIDSALSQNYRPIELIIIDDSGLNDPSGRANKELIEGYNYANLIFLQHTVNQGAAAARNAGITHANGEYIAFLDDDDLWLPEKLEKQVEAMQALPKEYAAVDTGFKSVYKNNKTKVVLPKLSGSIYQDLLVKHRGRAPKLSTLLCRKEALIAVGMFDPALPARQDLDLYLRIARTYKFYNLNTPLAIIYRNSPDRISSSLKKRIKGYDLLYEKYKADLKINPKIHSIYLEQHGNLLLREGRKKEAVKKFLHSFLAYPLHIKSIVKSLFVLAGLK